MKYKSVESLEYLKPDLINEFIDLLDKKDSKKLFIKIKNFHPSEIAYYIQTLNYDYRKKFINILSKNFDSRIFVELDQNFLVKIIDEFDYNVLLKAVKELESDDAASLIDTLDIKKKKENLFYNFFTKKDFD